MLGVLLASGAEAQLPGLPGLPGLPLPTLPLPLFTPTPVPSPTSPATGTVTPGTPTPGTPTPGGTPTAGPTFNPSATPVQGGVVSVSSAPDVTSSDGASVGAGDFTVQNTSGDTMTISAVEIDASDPDVLSGLSLTGSSSQGSQTVSVSPSTGNVFAFEPGIDVPAGESAQFALTATIAGSPVVSVPTVVVTPSTTATPELTVTPGATPTVTPSITTAALMTAAMVPGRITPTAGALACLGLLLGFCAPGIADERTRRLARALASLLGTLAVLAALTQLGGCGAEQSTSQTVTSVTAASQSGPLSVSGVPVSLGTVGRPQPLQFPGAASSVPVTATATPVTESAV